MTHMLPVWHVDFRVMRVQYTLTRAVVCLGMLVVAAGCQREISTREYVEQTDAAASGAVRVLDELEQSDSPAPDVASVTRLADELGMAVDDLRAIDPPERAAAAHQRLERSTADLEKSVRSLRKQLSSASANDQRLKVLRAWIASSKTKDALAGIDDAVDALDRAGYDLTTTEQSA